MVRSDPLVEFAVQHNPTQVLIDYLAINTTQPRPDYLAAESFLRSYAESLGLSVHSEAFVSGKPVVVISLVPLQETYALNGRRKSVVFYSHSDVVPFEATKWTYIGGLQQRGSQDMKSVTIQHIAALGALKRRLLDSDEGDSGLLRNVYVVVSPDEEISGADGVQLLRHSDTWKNMHVGLVLDEGLASGDGNHVLPLFYAEKSPLWVRIHAYGEPGHGSRFTTAQTASEKLIKTVNRLMDFRASSKSLWMAMGADLLDHGAVVSVSMAYLSGGNPTSINVVPSHLEAGFDVRVPPTVATEHVEQMIREWCEMDGTVFEVVSKTPLNPVTAVDDGFFRELEGLAARFGKQVRKAIFPAATDSRHLRSVGVPALGISYMPNTPVLLHEHDEVLDEKVFLEGVRFFEELVLLASRMSAAYL